MMPLVERYETPAADIPCSQGRMSVTWERCGPRTSKATEAGIASILLVTKVNLASELPVCPGPAPFIFFLTVAAKLAGNFMPAQLVQPRMLKVPSWRMVCVGSAGSGYSVLSEY